MPTVNADALLTAALSAGAALVAAWAGTRLGLRKFRAERAFDARLEWHRKLAETAKVLRNRLRALPVLRLPKDMPEDVREEMAAEVQNMPLFKDLNEMAFRFQELAETASLYATKRTYAAVRGALADMTKSAQPFAKRSAADSDEVVLEHAREMHRKSLAGMERVYDLLARDLREMLGLEPLDEHRKL
jgi:hypothetical protein